MTRAEHWLVLGQGTIGRLIAARFREAGASVTVSDAQGWEEKVDAHEGYVLCSVHRGSESAAVAQRIGEGGGDRVAGVVDLTTQATAELEIAETALEAVGVPHWAGGLVGGALSVERRNAVTFLGPSQTDPAVEAALGSFSSTIRFPTRRAAVLAKLTHNFVLFSHSLAVGYALKLGREHRCVEEFLAAIARGPAGRNVWDLSIVRDVLGGGPSSYTTKLVLKDVPQIRSSLDDLTESGRCVLDEVEKLLASGDDAEPFTTALYKALQGDPCDDEHRGSE